MIKTTESFSDSAIRYFHFRFYTKPAHGYRQLLRRQGLREHRVRYYIYHQEDPQAGGWSCTDHNFYYQNIIWLLTWCK